MIRTEKATENTPIDSTLLRVYVRGLSFGMRSVPRRAATNVCVNTSVRETRDSISEKRKPMNRDVFEN